MKVCLCMMVEYILQLEVKYIKQNRSMSTFDLTINNVKSSVYISFEDKDISCHEALAPQCGQKVTTEFLRQSQK